MFVTGFVHVGGLLA